MLQAILHGKSRRVDIDLEDSHVSWRLVFKKYEDLLTATIWQRLSYLSDQTFANFLQSLVGQADCGQLEEIEFWPTYSNGQDAEPDIVLKLKNINILIEIKPPAGGRQHKEQWQKEIDCFTARTPGQRLIFLAIGNNHADKALWMKELKQQYQPQLIKIKTFEWIEIRDLLQSLSPEQNSDKRIIADCLSALDLYGVKDIVIPDWSALNSLVNSHPLNNDTVSSIGITK